MPRRGAGRWVVVPAIVLAIAVGACGGRSTALTAPRPRFFRPGPTVGIDTISGRYSSYRASTLAWISNDSLWFEEGLLAFYKPGPGAGYDFGFDCYASYAGALADTALPLALVLSSDGSPLPESLGVASGGATWQRVGDTLYVVPRLAIQGGSWPSQVALSYSTLVREVP